MAELEIRLRNNNFAFMAAIDDATESRASVAPHDIDRIEGATIHVEVDDGIVALLTCIVTTASEHDVTIDSVDELVTAADIAERRHVTRAAITRYIHGDRGRGDFPASINPGARHELYRWLQVQAWFDDTKTSVDIAAVDIAIRLRQQLVNAPSDIRELCLDVVLAR